MDRSVVCDIRQSAGYLHQQIGVDHLFLPHQALSRMHTTHKLALTHRHSIRLFRYLPPNWLPDSVLIQNSRIPHLNPHAGGAIIDYCYLQHQLQPVHKLQVPHNSIIYIVFDWSDCANVFKHKNCSYFNLVVIWSWGRGVSAKLYSADCFDEDYDRVENLIKNLCFTQSPHQSIVIG